MAAATTANMRLYVKMRELYADRNLFVCCTWYKFIFYICCMFCQSTGAAAQIMEPPHNQTVPVNSVARFTCRNASFVVWQINSTQLLSDEFVETFRVQGFRVDSQNDSVLLANATLENNKTSITCVAGPSPTALVPSGTAVLIVFGKWWSEQYHIAGIFHRAKL